MATYPDTQVEQNEQTYPASHQYHAEAHVLSGKLERPIEQVIEQHAPVSLKVYAAAISPASPRTSASKASSRSRKARPECREAAA